MKDVQIKHMVDRFLQWKLPEDFQPDGGIRFEGGSPIGTNLFTADQAEAMVRFMVQGFPADNVGDLEKQEKMTSALWGFAYDLQHEPLTVTDGDGTKMNLEAMGRVQEIIASIFGLKLQEIQ